MKNTIGQNISIYRKKAGMTQEELSEKMNVTSQAVSKWENDLSYPDLECMNRLSRILGTTVDILINGASTTPEARVSEKGNVEKRIMVLSTTVRKPTEITASLRLPMEFLMKLEASDELADVVGEDNIKWVKEGLSLAKAGVVGTVLCTHTDDVDAVIEVIENEG